MALNKDINRMVILILIGVFISLWVMINAGFFLQAAIIYIVMGIVSIFFAFSWNKFGRKTQPIGIDANFIQDFLIGGVIGVAYIFLGSIAPFIGAIGIPNVQSIVDTVGRFLIIVLLAPIFEEIFFRIFVLDFLDEKAVDFPFLFSAIITGILFAVFHAAAYGGSLEAAQGSFIIAALVGVLFAYERKWTNSVITPIATHMVLNLFIGFIKLSVIAR